MGLKLILVSLVSTANTLRQKINALGQHLLPEKRKRGGIAGITGNTALGLVLTIHTQSNGEERWLKGSYLKTQIAIDQSASLYTHTHILSKMLWKCVEK